MMKGMSMVMKGSMWVTKDAPGAAEYLAYQKALAAADLAAARRRRDRRQHARPGQDDEGHGAA